MNNAQLGRVWSQQLQRAPRWLTKQAAVFAAELGGAAITHPVSGAGSAKPFAEHQPSRLVQAQLLLKLQWRHRSQRFEAMMERRGADMDLFGNFGNAEVLIEALLDQFDRSSDATGVAGAVDQEVVPLLEPGGADDQRYA